MANKSQTARQPRFAFDRNSPLGRFWRWWSGELVALVPQWLRQSAGSVGNLLLIEIDPHAVVLRRRVQGILTEQGRLDMQGGNLATRNIAFQALVTKLRKRDDQIALWLPDSQFLAKQIELPLAAAENLRQVLGFEMDRHTPFKADQVYFDFRVARRDSQNSRLVINLVAAPRAAVDAALEQLIRWGVPAHAVHVAGATAPGDDAIDLMPDERRITKTTVQHLVNMALFAFVVVLAIAAIAIPIWQKRQLAAALAPIVEQARQQAEATDALRREWDKRSAEYNFVLDKKHASAPLVLQIDELSRLLPDDTWVQQFDLKGKELQIQGETASSSKLIALVESSKMLRDASFRSPLTKGLAQNSERFHLGAEVRALSAAALAALRPPEPAAVVPPPVPVPGAAVVPPPNAPTAVPPAPAGAKVEPAKSASATAGKPPPAAAQPPAQPGKPEPKAAQPLPNPPPAQASAPKSAAPPVLKAPDKPSGATVSKPGSKP